MQYYPFDSRNPLYKSKIGAVASGESLKLRLLLHKDALCESAFLVLKNDSAAEPERIPLNGAEWLDDYRFYDCEISLNTGLYWYYFEYYSNVYGKFTVTKCEHCVGFVSDAGMPWQLTVYDNDFAVPEWLSGGVIYQIFPDRFYNSGKKKANVPEDRYLCTNWEKTPEHRMNGVTLSLGNDYYGGDLKGIEEKLDYLQNLGVTCIYLNPIFEAHSNHRYNTANYLNVDPLLGTTDDFTHLCKKAAKKDIKIILDGVFSHTGDDSIYFNKQNRYNSTGAYQSEKSPYYSWYNFKNFPNKYAAWWGVPTLPEVNENNPDFTEFITGENGILRYWMKLGASGWRLDVADELPDMFLENVRNAVKNENPEGFLLGEVWEDASNKISYGARRKFLLGAQLDSVMNYPFANAIVDFICNHNPCKFIDTVLDIIENYPLPVVNALMNHIGTHDTARIITRLARPDEEQHSRDWQAEHPLTEDEYCTGIKLLKAASLLQFTLPGVPSIYYGDEVGMQGYGDPFCRAGFPWGKENKDLLEHYTKLGNLRKSTRALKCGDIIPIHCNNGYVVYLRKCESDCLLVGVNTLNDNSCFKVPNEFLNNCEVIFGEAPDINGYAKFSNDNICALKVKSK